MNPKKLLDKLRDSVVGIDVHPAAVHLARSAWVLAVRPAIEAAAEDTDQPLNVTAPIYLGDALLLRLPTGDPTRDMFARHNVTVPVGDEENTELVFPRSLESRPTSLTP